MNPVVSVPAPPPTLFEHVPETLQLRRAHSIGQGVNQRGMDAPCLGDAEPRVPSDRDARMVGRVVSPTGGIASVYFAVSLSHGRRRVEQHLRGYGHLDCLCP